VSDASAIVSSVLNYARVLKNAGVGFGDRLEAELDRQINRSSRLLQSILSFVLFGPF
jgi:hypothetical protein